MNEKKIYLLLFLSIFLLTLVSAQSYYPAIGNNETLIPNFANQNNIFYGKIRDITPPTITITSPTSTITTSIYTFSLSTNEPTNCNYSINNAANISFNNPGGLTHSNSLTSLADGTYPVYVYCDDLSSNLKLEQTNFIFKYYSSGSGGQSTGGTTVITGGNETNQTFLNKTIIHSQLMIYQNQSNILTLYAYDNLGNLTDINKINIYANKIKINYTITNSSIGIYKVKFTISKTNYAQANLNFEITKGNIKLITSRNFLIYENASPLEKTSFWFSSFTLLRKMLILIFISLLLIIIMVFIILYRRKK